MSVEKNVQHTTALLSTFETMYQNGRQQYGFNRHTDTVQINLPGDASAHEHIALQPSNSISAHTRLAFVQWHQDFSRHLQAIGQAFAALFPGQGLTLQYVPKTDKEPSRFMLILGCTLGTHSNDLTSTKAIDTTLSRWKAPLARLARFLSLQHPTLPEPLFVFHRFEKIGTHSRVFGTLDTTFVHAHSLDDATALHAFHTCASGATPTPNPVDVQAISTVDAGFPITISRAAWQDELSKTLDLEAGAPTPQLETLAMGLEEALKTLHCEHHSTITLDLITQTVTPRFHTYPFVAEGDRHSADHQRAICLERAEAFCAALRAHLHTIHPTMLTGTVELRIPTRGPVVWEANMDGATLQFDPSFLNKVCVFAAQLAAVGTTGAYKTFLVIAQHGAPVGDKPTTKETNTNRKSIVVRAANPHHALLCLIAHNSPAKIGGADLVQVYATTTVAQADKDAAHTRVIDRQQKIYQ